MRPHTHLPPPPHHPPIPRQLLSSHDASRVWHWNSCRRDGKIQDPPRTTGPVHSQTGRRSWRLSAELPGLRDGGEFRTCVSRTLLRHKRLCQPRHRRQWRIQGGDRHDRNNSPKSTFDECSAGPDPAAHKASFTWVNNTEDSNCSQKALGNSAVLTRQPALVCGTIRSQRSDEGEDEDEQDDEMSEPTQTKKTKKRKEFETDETAKELRASLPFTVPSHATSLRPSDKT